MFGKVWYYDTRSALGLIEGSDGKHYHFSRQDCNNTEEEPKEGHAVEFQIEGTGAKRIILIMK